MKKIRQYISKSNFMILVGMALFVFALWSVKSLYNQDNAIKIMENSNSWVNTGYVNSFSPPIQEQSDLLVPSVPGLKATPSQPLDVSPDQPLGEKTEGLEILSKIINVSPDQPIGEKPDRLEIPSINLDAPILPEHYDEIYLDEQLYIQWRVPFSRVSGWHDTSALLGDVGNTVLNGHHNAYGEVFKDLIKLKEGDMIRVYSGESIFEYKVNLILLLPEKNQSMEERIKNASWIMPTTDKRLTLVTCWPLESNTHRLIVVAYPVVYIPQDVK